MKGTYFNQFHPICNANKYYSILNVSGLQQLVCLRSEPLITANT